MTDERAPSLASAETSGIDRRSFVARTAAAGVAAWAVPSVIAMDPVSAATGSCNGLSVCEFTTGLEGWTIDNSWGSGTTGLWNHNSEASRDGGSLHYGRGTTGNYRTGNSRNSGAVRSPDFEIPATGANVVTFSVWREVETQDPGYDRFRLLILGSSNQVLYQVASIGNTTGFETYSITLPTSYNNQTVQFQFDFDTRDGLYNDQEGVYVGRFQVTACQPAGAAGFAPFAASRSFEATSGGAPVASGAAVPSNSTFADRNTNDATVPNDNPPPRSG